MSKAKLAPAGTQPGTINPDNPREVCVACPQCPKLHWLVALAHGGRRAKLRAKGFQRFCQSCAIRKWHRQTDKTTSRVREREEHLDNGSIEYPGRRTPEDIRKSQSHFKCGICGEPHKANPYPARHREGPYAGICKIDTPWARLALSPKEVIVDNGARKEAYAKIKRLSRFFENRRAAAPKGRAMPFSVLAKKWLEPNQRENENSRSNHFYEVRHLTLFFDDLPAGEMSESRALAFRDDFLSRDSRRGKRTEATANQVMGCLREIYAFASERGWVRPNPFPSGAALTFKGAAYKSDRLVTVDDEEKLLAACVGRLADLRAPLLLLADTGMYEKERRALNWGDVGVKGGFLDVCGRQVEMTPRLRDELRRLSPLSGLDAHSPVWNRSFTSAFPELCLKAGLKGIVVSDFRRTFGARLRLAGRSLEEIAITLGVSDLNRLRRLLQINPEAEERERNSPSFKRFVSEQLRRRRGRKVGDTMLDYEEFLSNVKACVLEEWVEKRRATTAVRQSAVLTRYHNKYLGDRIAEATLKARLASAGYDMKWPEFVELTTQDAAST